MTVRLHFLPSAAALAWLALPGAAPGDDQGAAGEDLPWIEGSTTVVVLPDTERYSDDHPEFLEAQAAWIEANLESRNIAAVIHLGDVTQHNAPGEWDVARRTIGRLVGRVPLVLVPGNHDYDGNAPNRATSGLSAAFPVAEAAKSPSFGGVFEENRLDNSWHRIRIGECEWLVVALEMGPRDEVVEWADAILGSHADLPAIVVTHAYLFRDNVRYDHTLGVRQRASPHTWGNDGEQLWRKLVRRHPNTRIVLSGHVSTGGLGHLASEADFGNVVHQMMVDYEKMRGGGRGFLRLLEFLPDGRTVQVRTWSPALRSRRRSELEEFAFTLAPATRDQPAVTAERSTSRLAAAPRHRFRFDGDGGDGSEVRDALGGAHGVLRAPSGESRLDGAGRLVLAGGDGHVALPGGLLAGLDDVSIEIWFTPTAERYRWASPLWLGGADDWLSYTFRTLTVHRAEIAIGRHNEDIQREAPARPGERLHVVVTYDHDGAADGGPLLSWFRDGECVGTLATGLRLADIRETGNRIGPFEGSFEELRIHGRALTPAEVALSAAAGPDSLPAVGDPR